MVKPAGTTTAGGEPAGTVGQTQWARAVMEMEMARAAEWRGYQLGLVWEARVKGGLMGPPPAQVRAAQETERQVTETEATTRVMGKVAVAKIWEEAGRAGEARAEVAAVAAAARQEAVRAAVAAGG